jgi:hypothetical protein
MEMSMEMSMEVPMEYSVFVKKKVKSLNPLV